MADDGCLSVCEAMKTAVHRVGAALLLLPALPVMGCCFILVRSRRIDRGPFLYRGERLGYQKRPFTIYKVRSLVENAEKVIGADIARPGVQLEIPFGRFIRDTRLDELPQLLNVLKGDMDLVGPRPVRRVLYEKYSKTIRNYDLRFNVKPGLTGYSQLLTAHRTPKRIRAVIDNHFVQKRCNVLWDLAFVGLTGYAVCRRAARNILRSCRHAIRVYREGGSLRDLRGLARISGAGLRAFISESEFTTNADRECVLLDLNYYAVSLYSNDEYARDDCPMLVLRADRARRGRPKQAKCYGLIYSVSDCRNTPGAPADYRYVVFLTPASDLQRYLIDQYMLREAVL